MTFQPSSTAIISPSILSRFQSALQARLIETITVSVLLSLSLTGTSAWNVWQIYQGLQTTISKQFKLKEESNYIRYLDEVLTMSALMIVSTGDKDLRWERRYNESIPKLDIATASVLESLSPAEKPNSVVIDSATKKLVAFETEAFELVRRGKSPQALQILLGTAYQEQKKIYSDQTRITLNNVKQNIEEEIENYQKILLWSVIFAVISLAIMASTWSIVLVAVRGYIRDRQAAQLSITASQVDLIHLNDQLAAEVDIRSQQEQQIRSESELLQADVAHILNVVRSIQSGDLTIEADVNERATGVVSGTLNRLIESLAEIISAVLDTARTVTTDASQLEQVAMETAEQAQYQTVEVQAIQALIDKVNALTLDSLQQGIATESAVKLAKLAVVDGQQAMKDTIGGIDTLQQGTDQIVKRTELLTEFVGLAAQFSKDQKRVASLTRVLALNASTLSTRAVKEQNPDQFASLAKEFETIARQVSDLATETNHSLVSLQQRTDRIKTVTSGLSHDIDDINQLVQHFTGEVSKSRQAFDNIQTVIEQVSQMDRQVNHSNQDIVRAVSDTLTAIESIATVAQVTETKASVTREQVQSMGNLARRLLHMVEFFKLHQSPTQLKVVGARGNAPVLESGKLKL